MYPIFWPKVNIADVHSAVVILPVIMNSKASGDLPVRNHKNVIVISGANDIMTTYQNHCSRSW